MLKFKCLQRLLNCWWLQRCKQLWKLNIACGVFVKWCPCQITEFASCKTCLPNLGNSLLRVLTRLYKNFKFSWNASWHCHNQSQTQCLILVTFPLILCVKTMALSPNTGFWEAIISNLTIQNVKPFLIQTVLI